MSKKDTERKAAEAHDFAIRQLLQSQEAAWEDKLTVLMALGYKLPEKPLTSSEKKQLKKRADKIIRDVLIALIDGSNVEPEMRRLARSWLLMSERGRGRPVAKTGLIIEAVSDEYRKHGRQPEKAQQILDDIYKQTGLRIFLKSKPPLHKQILGKVSDRTGLGAERLKQMSKSPTAEFERVVKRLARESKRK